jgi:hypothetical protein
VDHQFEKLLDLGLKAQGFTGWDIAHVCSLKVDGRRERAWEIASRTVNDWAAARIFQAAPGRSAWRAMHPDCNIAAVPIP